MYCNNVLQEDPKEYGWEYASATLGQYTFRTTKGRFDIIRRRRHVRKLINEKPGAISSRAVFSKEEAEEAKHDGASQDKHDGPSKDKRDGPSKDKHDGPSKDKHDDPGKDKGKKPRVPRMHLEFKGEATKFDWLT